MIRLLPHETDAEGPPTHFPVLRRLAQSGLEHSLWERGVVGSNPAFPTILKPDWSNGMTGVSKTLDGGSIPSSGAKLEMWVSG